MRRSLEALALVLVGALALVLVLRGVDSAAFLTAVRGVDPARWLFATLMIAALHVARAVRWGDLVRSAKPAVTHRSMLSICSVGFLLINVLPFRLGEFVRPYLLAEREQIPFGAGVATVAIERVADVLALGALLVAVAAVAQLPAEPVIVAGRSWDVVQIGRAAVLGLLVPGALVLGGLVLLGDRAQHIALRLGSLAGARAGAFAAGFVGTFSTALHAVIEQGRALRLLTWTVAIWAASAVAFVAMATAFEFGAGMGFWDGAVILVCISVMLAVPGPPGFVGIYELGAAVALAVLGVDPSSAAAYAVLAHGTQLLVLAAFGVYFLIVDRIGLKPLLERSRGAAAGRTDMGPERTETRFAAAMRAC